MSPISRSHSSERETRDGDQAPSRKSGALDRDMYSKSTLLCQITEDPTRMNMTNLLKKYSVTAVMMPRSVSYDLPDLEQ